MLGQCRPGDADLRVSPGRGGERQIRFDLGNAISSDGAGRIRSKRTGDLTLIRIRDERYEVPDAVIFGG